MKNFKKAVALLIITICFINISCSKYEDGPKFSLRTKKARLAGNWSIDKVTDNGTDVTSQTVAAVGTGYRFNIEKDGKFKETGDGFSKSGSWTLGEDKDDVSFKYDNDTTIPNGTLTYRILKLKNKELWLRHTATNGAQEITHLKQ
jgi:hypothetical protein